MDLLKSVTVAVEGPTDRAAVERLFLVLGIQGGAIHICEGKGKIDKRLSAYNRAAQHSAWLVLRDLDHDAPCAPELVTRLLPSPAPRMRFRIVVRSIEAWFLSDAEAMAAFLGVSQQALPQMPDQLPNPRGEILTLARRARHRDVRKDLLPASGTAAVIGPGYTARMIEFAVRHWRPSVAAERSPSLARCMRSLMPFRSGPGTSG